MIDAVGIRHFAKRADVDTGKIGDVDAIFRWIAAPLQMGVDAAGRAEIMPRGHRAPLVKAETILAANDLEVPDRDAGNDRPAARAEGAVAAPKLVEGAVPRDLDRDRSAMAFAH